MTPTTNPTPLAYNPPTILTVGCQWHWELRHEGMSPCGYVLRLDVRDRTITDVGHSEGFHDADEFGFCLE